MNRTGKYFCSAPWNHLFIGNDGVIDSCCFSIHPKKGKEKTSGNIPPPSTYDLINSPRLIEIRENLLRGIKPLSCERCYNNERAGTPSLRQRMNSIFSQDLEFYKYALLETGRVKSLDLRLGNNCNLRCRMCSPGSSKRLIDEWRLAPSSLMNAEAEVAREGPPWSESEDQWEQLKVLFPGVQTISFGGGEPFLNCTHIRFLDFLIEAGYSSEITLKYITNLTVVPVDLVSRFGAFNKVTIGVSIDGIGKDVEYIRGIKAEKLRDNILKISKKIENNRNARIYYSTTIQAYNFLSLPQLLYFLLHISLPNVDPVPRFTYLYRPEFLQANVLPLEIKEQACLLLKNHLDAAKGFYNSTRRAKEIDDLYSFYTRSLETCGKSEFNKFKKYTRFFDKSRGENILDIIPELEKYW